jgi:hypothetical protein
MMVMMTAITPSLNASIRPLCIFDAPISPANHISLSPREEGIAKKNRAAG